MKNRLSRRQKLAAAAVVAMGPVLGSGAWGYLTTFGNGTGDATITATGPVVSASSYSGQIRPDRNDPITVLVTNPLDHAISVTQIPVGTSRGYAVANGDAFDCVAGSVSAGAQDGNGAIVADGDGVNALPDADGATTIAAGATGEFALWARFDTAGFPGDNQDGCLGQTVQLNFGPITYSDVP